MDQESNSSIQVVLGKETKVPLGNLIQHMVDVICDAESLSVTAWTVSRETCGRGNQALLEPCVWKSGNIQTSESRDWFVSRRHIKCAITRLSAFHFGNLFGNPKMGIESMVTSDS